MIQPLPAAMIRTTSLQNHLALEALRRGQVKGKSLHMIYLFRVLFLAYLLHDRVKECCSLDVFQSAEAALLRCGQHTEEGTPWQPSENDIEALQPY